MSKRKPKIEYYWVRDPRVALPPLWQVNWRLVGSNGETMCQSTQGYRDKADAERSVQSVAAVFAELTWVEGKPVLGYRSIGPGSKPV